MSKLAWLAVAMVVLALPIGASARGSCGSDFTAGQACAVNSPDRLAGRLTTTRERDYYVFSAPRGTKLRITIAAGGCVGVTVSCPDVSATVYDHRLRELGTTGVAEFQVEPTAGFSHTLGSAGTYYIVVTGDLGTETPPFGGPSSSVPSPYTLAVKASPAVSWPARHRHS
jgi:hypothetical protein